MHTTRGVLFYAAYKKEINSHLVVNATTLIPQVVDKVKEQDLAATTVLTELLDQVGRDRNLRKRYCNA